jgi:hypothetical protein
MESSYELLKEIVQAALAAYSLGPLSLLGTVILFSLRALKHFAPKVWAKLPPWAKLLAPFATAFIGTMLLSMSAGLLPALAAALTAGLGAIGLHHATKAAGASTKLSLNGNALRDRGLQLMLDVKVAPKLPPLKLVP